MVRTVDEIKEVLVKATGKLPTVDSETHEDIVVALIGVWGITRPPEIMLVNRLVSTWMKLRSVEKMLSKYDLFFEKKDEHGKTVGVNMNQLAYYLKSLEQEFRSYYKILDEKSNVGEGAKEQDFMSFLDVKEVE